MYETYSCMLIFKIKHSYLIRDDYDTMVDDFCDHNNLIKNYDYFIEIMDIANNKQVDVATSQSNLTFRFRALNVPGLDPYFISSGLPNSSSLLRYVPIIDPIALTISVTNIVPGSHYLKSLDPSYPPSSVPSLVLSSVPSSSFDSKLFTLFCA